MSRKDRYPTGSHNKRQEKLQAVFTVTHQSFFAFPVSVIGMLHLHGLECTFSLKLTLSQPASRWVMRVWHWQLCISKQQGPQVRHSRLKGIFPVTCETAPSQRDINQYVLEVLTSFRSQENLAKRGKNTEGKTTKTPHWCKGHFKCTPATVAWLWN